MKSVNRQSNRVTVEVILMDRNDEGECCCNRNCHSVVSFVAVLPVTTYLTLHKTKNNTPDRIG
jgi:hypothetical protein